MVRPDRQLNGGTSGAEVHRVEGGAHFGRGITKRGVVLVPELTIRSTTPTLHAVCIEQRAGVAVTSGRSKNCSWEEASRNAHFR